MAVSGSVEAWIDDPQGSEIELIVDYSSWPSEPETLEYPGCDGGHEVDQIINKTTGEIMLLSSLTAAERESIDDAIVSDLTRRFSPRDDE